MLFLKRCESLKPVALISFMSFLLLLPIFTGVGKVNNLFHISIISAMIYIFLTRNNIFNQDGLSGKSLGVVLIFLLYYSLTNLWSADPSNIESTLKHSMYFVFFILMFNRCIVKYGVLKVHLVIFMGCITLFMLTILFVDKSTILTNRLESGFLYAPKNVIDLGGYFAIGILSGLIVARESGKLWVFIPAAFLFIGLLLTQSRGPLLALIVSLLVLFAKYKNMHLRHFLYIFLVAVIISLFFFFTDYGNEFYQRMLSSYQQSFIRFGIWKFAFEQGLHHPVFGWGFDKEIRFINSIGQHVTTTHSIYFSAFLKGGVVGVFFLLALMITGLINAYKKFHQGAGLEASIYLFSLMFFITQGMFVIGGPGESWILFWLPLAIVLSNRQTR